MTLIRDSRHPLYGGLSNLWYKWRLTYQGGDAYINEYLKKFSKREDETQFADRKTVSYLPAFAKESVNDIRNAIFQRTVDVTREGGTETYQKMVAGLNGGVDLRGSTMNAFMGRQILIELLTMARVGIYVDMPQLDGLTLADNKGKRPYMYMYQAEDILNWNTIQHGSEIEFTSLLLRDWGYTTDEETGLAKEREATFRLIQLVDNKIRVRRFKDTVKEDSLIDEHTLDIEKIPFVLLELSDSLLKDVANYQAALLNLASGDMFYLCNANFPYLIEMYDPRIYSLYGKGPRGVEDTGEADFDPEVKDSEAGLADEEEKRPGVTREERVTGPTQGKRYPKGLIGPEFIHPSAEPVKASMEKQAAMQEEIRRLLSLALSNIQPRMASAEAKQMDERGMESGLSGIALEMEHGERKVAQHVAAYEGSNDVATVKYPERYSLQSSADRRDEIKELRETKKDVPSQTGRKAISKKVVELAVGNRLSDRELAMIFKEIDSSDFMTGDPDIVQIALDGGLGSNDVLARSLGLPGGKDLVTAAKEHAERAARVAKAQSSIRDDPRGVDDLQTSAAGQDKEDKKDA